jgi:N-acetylglucosamine-6-phosphate deacetylase
MRRFLTGARIFTGSETLTGMGVLIEDGVILDLCSSSGAGDAVTTRLQEAGLLVPGFIDAQVNGGGGVLFNDAPGEAAIRTIVAAHRRFGTTGLLPTFVTDSQEKMFEAARAAAALARRPGNGVLGLHLEGPFLNPVRRGVHCLDFIRRPEQPDIDGLCALAGQFAGGRLLVSLAPEMVEDAMIRRLSGAGIAVSGAHSAASLERTAAAIAAGISGFTHLFNAMPPMVNRDPGIAAAALADPGSWCGIIADGIHVHPALLRLALAVKPRGKLFLVTDAMAVFGTDADGFTLYGARIARRNGRLATEDGTLAGADLDLPAAIRNCVAWLDLELEEALRMASLYPAEFLGLADRRGRIAPGYVADLTLLGAGLEVLDSWVGGA